MYVDKVGLRFKRRKKMKEKSIEVKSTSSEVVKEIVHGQLHLTGLSELDSIVEQIKALESMKGENNEFIKIEETE